MHLGSLRPSCSVVASQLNATCSCRFPWTSNEVPACHGCHHLWNGGRPSRVHGMPNACSVVSVDPVGLTAATSGYWVSVGHLRMLLKVFLTTLAPIKYTIWAVCIILYVPLNVNAQVTEGNIWVISGPGIQCRTLCCQSTATLSAGFQTLL